MSRFDGGGVWSLLSSSQLGTERMLARLDPQGSSLEGEISSLHLGTLTLTQGSLDSGSARWVVSVTSPVIVDIEFSVYIDGDRLQGESKSDYGIATITGKRSRDVDWVPWGSPHVHRTTVRLPDGTNVVAVSYDADDPYGRKQPPDFGLYFDPRWGPPWEHDHLDWPDFGLPADPPNLVPVLADLLRRSRAGQRVELGCLGGHGRTGTALAWLAILTGQSAETAVDWVRENYCPHAIETSAQEQFIADL